MNKFLNFVICSTIFIVSQSHTSRVMPGLRGDDDGVQLTLKKTKTSCLLLSARVSCTGKWKVLTRALSLDRRICSTLTFCLITVSF